MKRLTVIALIVLAVMVSCEIFNPPITDYSNKILFTSARSGKQQLYMIKPNGRGLTQITDGEYSHFCGRWSPNADKIVCNTDERLNTVGNYMVIINSDTTERTLLRVGTPRFWDPLGDKIFYMSWMGAEVGIDNRMLCSIDLEGNDKRIISEVHYGNCSISPDGDKIIFCKDTSDYQVFTIFDFPELTNPQHLGHRGSYPQYSNAGDKIAYSFNNPESEGWSTIYTMNSDGSNIQKIVEESTEIQYAFAKWSPNDDKIIFLGIDLMMNWYLYMVNSDGTDFHLVLYDNTVTSCDWSK